MFAYNPTPEKSANGPFHLKIVLRTHNRSNIHADNDSARYCGTSKTQLMLKCVSSLIASMNACRRPLHLTVLDDHSTDEWLDLMTECILPRSVHPVELIQLEHGGFNASALAQFEFMARCDGLVYSIEDDYLHEVTAISELLDTYDDFGRLEKETGRKIALYPFDMPDNYVPPWLTPCTVVLGPKRHWRTNTWTTNTMLIDGAKVRQHWYWFELYAREYRTKWGEKNNIHEGTTLSNMFREDVLLFTPIPSMALHMQFETQRDPFLNWKLLWNSVPDWTSGRIVVPEMAILPTDRISRDFPSLGGR